MLVSNMKTYLFILNVVSAILLVNLAFSSPSITGAVTFSDPKSVIASPLGFANVFVIVTIALDIYFYMKSRE